MPETQQITRAYLQEIVWTPEGQVRELKDRFEVQFNPASLKVTYTNQRSGGEQGSPIQFVGRGTTKLALELIFDVTAKLRGASGEDDVRALTQRVTNLIKPDTENDVSEDEDTEQFIPPGVRFQWGNFLFEGVIDSIDETLDFFSPDGKPLRANISLSVSRQDIFIAPVSSGGAGATPQTPASAGDSVQQLCAAQGKADAWKGIAAANGIENPRQLEAGALLDLNVSAGAGISAGAGASVGASVSAGASVGFSL